MDFLNQLVKAALINAACTQAAASVGVAAGDDGKLAVDPLVADAELQGKNTLVYETAKIHYNVLVKAFQDKTGIWPDPKVAAPLLEGIAPLLSGIGPKLPELLKLFGGGKAVDILSLLTGSPAPAPAPAAPVKAPGSEL